MVGWRVPTTGSFLFVFTHGCRLTVLVVSQSEMLVGFQLES